MSHTGRLVERGTTAKSMEGWIEHGEGEQSK